MISYWLGVESFLNQIKRHWRDEGITGNFGPGTSPSSHHRAHTKQY